MNLLKSTTFSWEQLGLLKFGVLFIGVAVGAYWPATFGPYVWWLVIIGLILCIPPTLAWLREH